MPTAPRKPCGHPGGCKHLTNARFCEQHERIRAAAVVERRSRKTQLYGPAWRRESKQFLEQNRWCIEHLAIGEVVPATVTDHRVPHRGNEKRFWDKKNWQPLCKQHHDRKTALEDSSFALGF
jgi:5-methylcytosine-specific restriction protein A